MCKLWKLAATSKDFYKLKYFKLSCKLSDDDNKRMSFEELFEIFKLIASKLKYAMIRRCKNDWEAYSDILVTLDILESIKTFKIDSFSGATKKQW